MCYPVRHTYNKKQKLSQRHKYHERIEIFRKRNRASRYLLKTSGTCCVGKYLMIKIPFPVTYLPIRTITSSEYGSGCLTPCLVTEAKTNYEYFTLITSTVLVLSLCLYLSPSLLSRPFNEPYIADGISPVKLEHSAELHNRTAIWKYVGENQVNILQIFLNDKLGIL